MKSISVVTISFNQKKYLSACLISVAAQRIAGDQHIVVDPGSIDGSRELLEAECHRLEGMRLVLKSDSGPADGLNNGFSQATGQILSYLNSDDYYLPGALEWVREFFDKNPRVDVLIGAIKILKNKGRLLRRGRVVDYPSRRRLFFDVFQYYQQATFFKKEIFDKVGGFNMQNRTCWDRELLVDMAIAGARFHVTSKPLAVFRIHGESITGASNNSIAYALDRKRIAGKVQVNRPSNYAFCKLTKTLLLMEAKINPLRWLKQLRWA